MKTKLITFIALLIMGAMNMYAQKGKTLIAYFSWSGNTQHVAEYIARQTGGTLFRIEPVNLTLRNIRPAPKLPRRKRNRTPGLPSRIK